MLTFIGNRGRKKIRTRHDRNGGHEATFISGARWRWRQCGPIKLSLSGKDLDAFRVIENESISDRCSNV